jgi:hypothetical protein
MMFDHQTAIVDRTSVARPQRLAPRTTASAVAPRRTRCDEAGPVRAPVGRMSRPGGAISRTPRPHAAFRSPTFLSNDSAGSDDGAVAGLEGAQTWASR